MVIITVLLTIMFYTGYLVCRFGRKNASHQVAPWKHLISLALTYINLSVRLSADTFHQTVSTLVKSHLCLCPFHFTKFHGLVGWAFSLDKDHYALQLILRLRKYFIYLCHMPESEADAGEAKGSTCMMLPLPEWVWITAFTESVVMRTYLIHLLFFTQHWHVLHKYFLKATFHQKWTVTQIESIRMRGFLCWSIGLQWPNPHNKESLWVSHCLLEKMW